MTAERGSFDVAWDRPARSDTYAEAVAATEVAVQRASAFLHPSSPWADPAVRPVEAASALRDSLRRAADLLPRGALAIGLGDVCDHLDSQLLASEILRDVGLARRAEDVVRRGIRVALARVDDLRADGDRARSSRRRRGRPALGRS